ncbi:hypothetical protein ABTI62_18825, partial [Acinetobacter baumannii]
WINHAADIKISVRHWIIVDIESCVHWSINVAHVSVHAAIHVVHWIGDWVCAHAVNVHVRWCVSAHRTRRELALWINLWRIGNLDAR